MRKASATNVSVFHSYFWNRSKSHNDLYLTYSFFLHICLSHFMKTGKYYFITINRYHLTAATACNFGKGKWVKDSTRPFYSGFGCKQWLSSMWACRLTQRTDFEYEKFRWKPKNCDIEKFTGSKFLKRYLLFSLNKYFKSLVTTRLYGSICSLFPSSCARSLLIIVNISFH